MLVKEKIGNINFYAINNRKIDNLLLDWYETNKRILHKKTVSGKEIVMKFLNENQQLTEGDVIYDKGM
jgi:urease accessory protein